ncbi:MAG TPA: VOC family protein [Chloroflexia bacterium]|nr:VOC family protein [Chloroflexia bacterium]
MNGPQARIGHVHLKVRDLDKAGVFYTDVLGLRKTESITWVGDDGSKQNYLFLSFGDEHHDIALKEVGLEAELPKDGDVGLFHFAIEVPTVEIFIAFHKRVQQAGVQTGPVDHLISKAFYLRDPDNNGIEVYVDTRQQNGRENWNGENVDLDMMVLEAGLNVDATLGIT